MTSDKPTDKPATRDETMPPRCDEYSGGGGSFSNTRERGMPGRKQGDCDRIGNAPASDQR